MEGEPKTDRIANTVTRAIYVLEYASGPNQNEVVLYVYTKVDNDYHGFRYGYRYSIPNNQSASGWWLWWRSEPDIDGSQ